MESCEVGVGDLSWNEARVNPGVPLEAESHFGAHGKCNNLHQQHPQMSDQ